jgi:hypothetical protein
LLVFAIIIRKYWSHKINRYQICSLRGIDLIFLSENTLKVSNELLILISFHYVMRSKIESGETGDSRVVSIYATCFIIKTLFILPTQCICLFRMVLTINSDCFPKQH